MLFSCESMNAMDFSAWVSVVIVVAVWKRSLSVKLGCGCQMQNCRGYFWKGHIEYLHACTCSIHTHTNTVHNHGYADMTSIHVHTLTHTHTGTHTQSHTCTCTQTHIHAHIHVNKLTHVHPQNTYLVMLMMGKGRTGLGAGRQGVRGVVQIFINVRAASSFLRLFRI
jgi:hypothetical protein